MTGGTTWRWLPTLAGGVLLAVFADAIPWRAIGSELRTTSASAVGTAMVLTLAATLARAVLFWQAARTAGPLSLRVAVRATIAAVALNAVLVGQLGEAARFAIAVRGSALGKASVAAAIVFEHGAVSAVYLTMVLVTGAVVPLPAELASWRPVALVALACLGVAGVAIARTTRKTCSESRGSSGRWGPRLRGALTGFAAALQRKLSVPALAAGLGLAAMHWALQFGAFHAAVRSVGAGLSIDVELLGFLVLAGSGGLRATPGNVGIAQAVLAAVIIPRGVSPSAAVAIGLVWQVVQAIPLAIAALYLVGGAGRLPARALLPRRTSRAVSKRERRAGERGVDAASSGSPRA